MAKRNGIATVEFALVIPLILLLLAGVLDYTLLLRSATAVADAARAGALYGSLSTFNSSNTAGMQSAAVNAAPDIPGISAAAAQTCQCPGGTSVSCSGTCGTGAVEVYVQVTARTTVTPIFSYSQLPYSGAVSSTAKMRAQ